MSKIIKDGFHDMNGCLSHFSFEPVQEKTFADCTTHFANVRKVLSHYVPISICGKAPEGWNGLEYGRLAPKWWLFMEWKENHDDDLYAKRFRKEVLDALNPHDVWRDLRNMSDGSPFALVCHEKPNRFCHRHLVSEWLRKAGYEIREFVGL